jgi:hyperosmotically inducible periplasmic protein
MEEWRARPHSAGLVHKRTNRSIAGIWMQTRTAFRHLNDQSKEGSIKTKIGDRMMSRRYHTFQGWLGVLLLGVAFVPVLAQDAASKPATGSDNSAINQRDRNQSEPTADDQQNNRSDLEITKEIRRSLTQDKSLSTYAQNVKVIAQNGKVTLKGPVRSADEKSAVLAKAAQVAGEANINDEMTVVPKRD